MVVSQTCISISSLTAAALLFAAAQPDSGRAQPSEPVASVMLRFEITSDQYRHRLRESLTVLEHLMADSVRAMFQARFPFIEWNPSGAVAPDTMVFRVTPVANSGQTHVLEIALVTASASADPFRTDFEKSQDFGARRDWKPDAIARTWRARAQRILENEGQRLVEHVISQIPIGVPIEIKRDSLKVIVRLATERLNAAENPRPRFRVAATVLAPGPAGQRTSDPVHLQLGGCRVGEGKAYYYCDIDSVTIGDRTRPAHRHRGLFRPGALISPSLHIVAYRARPRRASGTVTSVVVIR